MEKNKTGKTPFIHPSLASSNTPNPTPAQRGKSRIAPGAQRGVVIEHAAPPETVAPISSVPQELLTPPPAVQQEVAPSLQSEEGVKIEQRKHDVINKLLLFTQPLHKTAEIGGMQFRFKVLTPVDTAHVIKIFSSMPEDEQTLMRNRVLNLAAALVDVDGVSLESIYKGPLTRDIVLMRYSELMKWSNPVINGVLAAYDKLLEDIKQEYLPDFLKQPKKESTG